LKSLGKAGGAEIGRALDSVILGETCKPGFQPSTEVSTDGVAGVVRWIS
jgi:hypothetical protein